MMKDAEMPIDTVLPPPETGWTVVADFVRFMPGECVDEALAIYQIALLTISQD